MLFFFLDKWRRKQSMQEMFCLIFKMFLMLWEDRSFGLKQLSQLFSVHALVPVTQNYFL